ncbi:unnamed protein product, partial [Ectocarpus fasciculatus]
MSVSESATPSPPSATYARAAPGDLVLGRQLHPRRPRHVFSVRRSPREEHGQARRRRPVVKQPLTATGLPTRLGWFCLANTPRACLGLTGPPAP